VGRVKASVTAEPKASIHDSIPTDHPLSRNKTGK
jgi:hypothetical protein